MARPDAWDRGQPRPHPSATHGKGVVANWPELTGGEAASERGGTTMFPSIICIGLCKLHGQRCTLAMVVTWPATRHGGVLAGSAKETAGACAHRLQWARVVLGLRQSCLARLQRGMAACTAVWRPERGGGRPCSGEVATVASKLTMALASMTHGDAKTCKRVQGGRQGCAWPRRGELAAMVGMARWRPTRTCSPCDDTRCN
jgi:hypothetical protein